MNKDSIIYIAGHSGMVGSAIHKYMISKGYQRIITVSHDKLDLIKQKEVDNFFETHKPEIVIDAAARVGGIVTNNKYRADFIYENIMIQTNLIHACYIFGTEKFLFLGSSCIYPKLAPQPLK